jgi:HK97 family phage major capsid protein
MENKELELLAEIKKQNAQLIDEKLKGLVSQEQLDGIKGSLDSLKDKGEIEAVKSVIESMSLEIKAMKEGSQKTVKGESFKSQMKSHEGKLLSLKNRDKDNVKLEFKSFNTDTIGGVWTNFLEPQYIDGIVKTPDMKAQFNILNYVTVGQAFSEVVKWIEEDVETGSALFIDECVAKPDVSKTWKRNEATVRKVADYTRVCDEVLIYLDWAEQEIKMFLEKLVYKAIQEQIINGDGLGQNLNGITTQATAFVAGSLAASVPMANEADAIAAMATQIACLGYSPNYAFVNCVDMFKMKQALKATDGQYLDNRAGVTLVDCPYIPAGSVLVGDFTKSEVRFLQNIIVEMGMNGEDFRENAVSLRAEAFLTHYIASNNANAFIYDTFANVIALINKP